MKKKILDACSGSRMFWFDRLNPMVIFGDIRKEDHVLCDGRSLRINPDILMDFRNIPYPCESFKLVVFDPPHMKSLGAKSWMAKKYGVLGKTWKEDIKRGFDECMRVLEPDGILIFKWNEHQIKLNELLGVIVTPPLFGHNTGKAGKTFWLCFIKLSR